MDDRIRLLERAAATGDPGARMRLDAELARTRSLGARVAQTARDFVRAVNGGRRSRALALAHVVGAIRGAGEGAPRFMVASGSEAASGAQVTTDATRAAARAETAALVVYRTPEGFVLAGRVVPFRDRFLRAAIVPDAASDAHIAGSLPNVLPLADRPVLRLTPVAADALLHEPVVHHTKWGKTAKHGQTPECERAKPRRERKKLPDGTPMSGMRDEVTCSACLAAGLARRTVRRPPAPSRETWRYDARLVRRDT